ncbi:CHASE4 domain-containing protein [Methanotrichaceae archaeon M04Ac]|jgi:PAS domain S-box-containing protein|uniref:histidine kinase n=1 Tax=Candidatus Methanocrinis alkalitolerans TaxID=3033395 RepID=A0ABT5XBR8_9EURY|nr:CHASE4 domain-containing protein [Candidatus Methanocrinis alkalitolerans]MCR3883829.1 ATP-binding protein [Methanothrix sp.]MDF0592160.1 CHASE4 domain-containing protein [Candidatus Methanocrinis alkalitolerans]
MTLRKSTLLVTGALIFVMIAIISGVMILLMTKSLDELEEEDAGRKIETIAFALQEELAALGRISGDWAPWDETSQFVSDVNEDYVLANLNEATLNNLGVSFMLFYNSSGELVYATWHNPAVPYLAEGDHLIYHPHPEDHVAGIIALDGGVMMISSRPILDSQWKGPIEGTLVVGRHLDEARVEELGRRINGVLRIVPVDPHQAPSKINGIGYRDSPVLIRPVDDETLLAFKTIEDIRGSPSILLEAHIPRDIHQRGTEIMGYLLMAMVLASFVFGGVVLIFLERSVLSPLSVITTSVDEIKMSEEPDKGRISELRRGELGTLADSINEMLDRLEIYNHRLLETEERFRAIFETAQDCIFIKDRESRYVQVNPVMEKIFKMSSSEILGKGDEILFGPETAAIIREADSQVLSGRPFAGEVSREIVDGISTAFHAIKVPLRDDQGNIVGICGISRDITYLKDAEMELVRRDMLLSAAAIASYTLLINSDIDRVIIDALQLLGEAVEADRAYIFENRTEDGEVLMSQRYEWTKGEIEPQINNPVLQNLPYLPDSSRFYETILRGRPYRGLVKDLPEPERAYLEPQGIVSILIVPIIMEDQLWGFIGFDDCHSERVWTNSEISALQVVAGIVGGEIIRSRTRRELERAKDELEERIGEVEAKNAEMERFVYTVSHDLRSPLVTIQGFAGFLREDISDGDLDNIETDLGMIEDAAVKMDHLLKDTLELSRIGRVVNPPEEVSFGEVVHEVLEALSDKIKARLIKVVLPESWPAIRGDRLRMEEALTNLVENSIKYMGVEPHPEIEIGWRKEGVGPVFFVRDNGIGIESDQREKIFDLFYKLDPESEGSGVGLAIVRRIIEVHGGKIWAEPGEGKGTTVLFTLPTS